MKKFTALLTFCVIFIHSVISVGAVSIVTDIPYEPDNNFRPEVSDEIVSKDGKYGYVLDSDTGEAYFSHSFEKEITVLDIPDKIDGHKITGTIYGYHESRCIAQINFSRYITDIYICGLNFFDIPSCRINLNEGLETIHQGACSERVGFYDFSHYLDMLVFPSTLKQIYRGAFGRSVGCFVFQSDAVIDMVASDNDELIGNTALECETAKIYYTGNASNTSANAFDKIVHFRPAEMLDTTPKREPGDYVIYHKPGAAGFEKFEATGYTVKEYSEEFWKNDTNKASVQKLEATDVEIVLPKNSFTLKNVKVYPDEAKDARVWFFPLSMNTYGIPAVSPNGLITALPGKYKTFDVIAVAENGQSATFTVTLSDRTATTQTTSDAPGSKETNQATSDAPGSKETNQTELDISSNIQNVTDMSNDFSKTDKSESNEIKKTTYSGKWIVVAVAGCVILAAGIVVLAKKKNKK